MKIILAQPRGFCAGVERAITIVDKVLELYDSPVYVRHEIVHNRRVVEDLKRKGVTFVDEIEQIPKGEVAVFSAHGVSEAVEQEASQQGVQPIDATCPLVTKVHKEGQRYAAKGYDVVLIGHRNHPEVEGTLGRIEGPVFLVEEVEDVRDLEVRDPQKVAYITQTTLSVDDTREIIEALRARFPKAEGPDLKDICYATQNRQTAVRSLAAQVDLILVVGGRNSSNSNRLCEVGESLGVPSYLIEDPALVDPSWWKGKQAIGITAGASTPEALVQDLIEVLGRDMELEISTMKGVHENVQFGLPASLQKLAEARQSTSPAE